MSLNKDVFAKSMLIFTNTFPNKSYDLSVTYEFLKDIDDERFQKAIADICSTEREMYSSTNIIALIRDYAFRDSSTIGPELAFRDVINQAESVGRYGYPKFDDPICEQTVESMGWESICASEIKDRAVIRAQFMKIYTSLELRKINETKRVNKGIIGPILKLIGNKK